MFSIRTRLLLLLLPVTLALLGASGYFAYLKTNENLTRSLQGSLRTIVDGKQAALAEYIEAAEMAGAAIAATEVVQTYVELTNRNLRGSNLEMLERLERRVADLLRSFQETHWKRYHHVFLLNRSNRIVISPSHGAQNGDSASALLGMDLSKNRWAMGSLQKGKTMLSDYSSWPADDHGHQLLFYPVRDASNRIQAVIGIELHIPYQQLLLVRGFSVGNTGRIYMTSGKGEPLDQTGIAVPAGLTGDALAQVKSAGAWSGRRVNSQGREVFGYYAAHHRYPWILAAEVDTDEAFAELRNLQWMLAAAMAAVPILIALLSLIFANGLVRPLRELKAQIQRISRGEFNIEIMDTRRKDEVGQLVVALQQLVFSLQLVSKKLRQAKALKKAS